MRGHEESPRSFRRVAPWLGLGAVVVAGALFLFLPRGGERRGADSGGEASALVGEPRAAILYFGDAAGRGLVEESREIIAADNSVEARIEAAVRALVLGPQTGAAVRTLPPEAALRRVFFDDDARTVYLDFTPALVTRHPGGSAAEYAMLATLVRTLGSNFPEVARLQILVDGEPVETIGGHFDTSQPLEIASWR